MDRQEIIETLIHSALMYIEQEPSKEDIENYRKHLESKSDMALKNLLMINC